MSIIRMIILSIGLLCRLVLRFKWTMRMMMKTMKMKRRRKKKSRSNCRLWSDINDKKISVKTLGRIFIFMNNENMEPRAQ
mmetsp:Transcript_24008/g.40910  ORF Transcript_24008/g.40910 Transcript_24008/m.40910 type:complete len:80 (-) Transcript_24008:185-424(-)